jgi:hypothetical protein
MSQDNVDRIRAAFEAFNRTGEIVVDHLAPDFELHQASSIVDTAGVFHGPDALREVLSELQGAFEELSFEGRSSSRRRTATSSSSSTRVAAAAAAE